MPLESEVPEEIVAIARGLGLALAAVAGPVPTTIVAVLDKLLDGRASQLMRRRIEALLDLLREEFERIAVSEWDRQFLESQDFAHLVILAVDAAARTRQREKIRAYAKIVTSAAQPQWADKVDRVEEALRALIDVTEADFLVLTAAIRWMRGPGESQSARGYSRPFSVEDIQRSYSGPALTGVGMKTYLARLSRLGVVLDIPTAAGDAEHGSYTATHLLSELADLMPLDEGQQ
jgi:hypothetical protein